MPNDTWKTTIEILIGGMIAIIPGVLAWITATRAAKKRLPTELKVSAGDAADKVSMGYDRLVENLQERLQRVECRLTVTEEKAERQASVIKDQEKRIAYLEAGIIQLIHQLKELSVEPVFDIHDLTPPDKDQI